MVSKIHFLILYARFFFNVEEAKVVKAIVTVLGVLVGSMSVLGLGHY